MQKLMRMFHKNEKGFTLVELMVVVVIIGILVAIAIPIYGQVTANAEKNACFANQRTIEGAASMAYAEIGSWPTMAELSAGVGDDGPWLQENPVCPTANIGYTLSTAGKVTGLEGTNCAHGHYSGGTW